MVRDFDLLRKILLSVQTEPAGSQPLVIKYPNEYDQLTINEHIALLIESGLLKGKILRTDNRITRAVVTGLTWEGHDFIQAAEQESVWTETKSIVKEKGGAITFDLLKEILLSVARNSLGLP